MNRLFSFIILLRSFHELSNILPLAQGARRGRPIAAAPCTPRLWRQNRRFAVPSAYAFRLPGRARGNIPVKRALSPHPCGLPRPPDNASAIQTPPEVAASFQLKANANIAASFQLKKTLILLKPMSPRLKSVSRRKEDKVSPPGMAD